MDFVGTKASGHAAHVLFHILTSIQIFLVYSVRDQARRVALKSESKRRETWVAKETVRSARSISRASSEVARDEMLAMVTHVYIIVNQ